MNLAVVLAWHEAHELVMGALTAVAPGSAPGVPPAFTSGRDLLAWATKLGLVARLAPEHQTLVEQVLDGLLRERAGEGVSGGSSLRP